MNGGVTRPDFDDLCPHGRKKSAVGSAAGGGELAVSAGDFENRFFAVRTVLQEL